MHLFSFLRRLRPTIGASGTEYGILVALVSIVCLVAAFSLGRETHSAFSTVGSEMDTALASAKAQADNTASNATPPPATPPRDPAEDDDNPNSPMILEYTVEAGDRVEFNLVDVFMVPEGQDPNTGPYGRRALRIEWGNGEVSTCADMGEPTCDIQGVPLVGTGTTYTRDGVYTVRVYGKFGYFAGGVGTEHLTAVRSWGDVGLTNLSGSFNGIDRPAINLASVPPSIPSTVRQMNGLFQGNTTAISGVEHWNVSNVEMMNGLFSNTTTFNADLSGWYFPKATSIAGMFSGAQAFNQDISEWDVSRVQSFYSLFASPNGPGAFAQDLSAWDTSAATTMDNMFQNQPNIRGNLSGWCVSGIAQRPTNFAPAGTGLVEPVWGTCPPTP